MESVPKVRPSPIAGTWYNANPAQLAAQVDGFIQQAQLPELNGEVIGLIAPHAGYRYSGRTAGFAYRAVQGKAFDIVAALSPLHAYARPALLTSAHSAYETPLGVVEIDQGALGSLDDALRAQNASGLAPVAFDQEHSLEIQLPFLQRALSGPFKLLPVMVRAQRPEEIETFGRALADVLQGRRALVIASTDLSHFYPESAASQLDAEMLRQFAALSPEGALRAEQSGTGHACGVSAAAAALWAARALGANAVEILHHSTSAEETRDFSSVVGYGAAAILKRP